MKERWQETADVSQSASRLLGILRADKTAIIHAASKAEQAFKYLRAFSEPAAVLADEPEETEAPALREAA